MISGIRMRLRLGLLISVVLGIMGLGTVQWPGVTGSVGRYGVKCTKLLLLISAGRH